MYICMQAGVPAGLRRWAVRTALAGACLVAARFVPFLAYVMSLIGSFLTISVSVIFPAACHLSIFQASAWPSVLYARSPSCSAGLQCAIVVRMTLLRHINMLALIAPVHGSTNAPFCCSYASCSLDNSRPVSAGSAG